MALGALLLLAAMGAGAEPCTRQDLGGFSICVPPGWQLQRGGLDSNAGLFIAPGLQLSFDLGRHADPLPLPEGAGDASEAQVSVDGRAARRVGYSLPRPAGSPMHYLGLHVPDLGASPRGQRLRLTLLAESTTQARLREAASAFSTVRIKRTNAGSANAEDAGHDRMPK